MKKYLQPSFEFVGVKYENGVCNTPGVVSFKENKTPVDEDDETVGGAAIFREGIWDED